ncbi:hypothetical protein GCM10009687_11530 [Asanoa iriomotensis]|uniref:Uncharacterized protein n=1 Tax=Asanoa iriomotensis TaxID=234613 RepID=A0ABQ4C7I7_9ACTN|nr:hypothetical protein Air01nite_47990 [Asanoa iriomotensis]
MIRGSALPTIVEARIDTKRPTMRPESAWSTSRRDIRAGEAPGAVGSDGGSAGGDVDEVVTSVVIECPYWRDVR